MQEIPVFIVRSDPALSSAGRYERTKHIFSDEIFIVQKTEIPTNFDDSVQVFSFLLLAEQKYPDRPIIIVKDSSISVASSSTVADIVSIGLVKPDWDIFYLGSWMDLCSLYSDSTEIPGSTVKIVRTQSSYGFQAVVLNSKARKEILALRKEDKSCHLSLEVNRLVSSGKIQAITLTVNLINFDATASLSNTDYAKTMKCRAPSLIINKGGKSIPWWVFPLVLLVIVAFVFYFIGSSVGKSACAASKQKRVRRIKRR